MAIQHVKKHRVTHEVHRVDELVRDERVNRALSPARVSYLERHLILDGVGVFVVSKRDDGSLVILDGGHRAAAATGSGYGELEVQCEVHHDLDRVEEARLFLLHNNKLGVRTMEQFRIEVEAELPNAVTLDKLIRKHGFVPLEGHPRQLVCISTIRNVLEVGDRIHPKVVDETLRIIATAWGNEGSALKDAVQGVGWFVHFHPNGGGKDAADYDHLISALSKRRNGAHGVAERATWHRQAGGLTGRKAALAAVIDAYNERLPVAKKIKNGH